MRLTQTVQKGGCAAKVAASELRKILNQVKFPVPHPALMVDGGLFDDAAIYKVTDDVAMVQTLDFFTPILDTPKLFGAVAAANALSDVYAMGGLPKTAMAILAFPLTQFENDVIVDVLQGASDKIQEAQANFVGGHSIDDDTLKFGLSVTGFVHPAKVWSNAGVKPGDAFILTKPLGTGTMTAALKRQEVSESDIADVIESMAQLNATQDLLGEKLLSFIHAATDVTGFGLMGHGMQMSKASQVSIEFWFNQIPRFGEALSFIEKGFLTKAHRTNREYTQESLVMGDLNSAQQTLLFDPQTSGGLLLAVDSNSAEEICRKLRQRFHSAAIIGQALPQKEKALFVSPSRS